MRSPSNFRPTKRDVDALDTIAADFPIYADSTTELIRIALTTYPKYKQLSAEIQELRERIKALEVKHGN